MTYAEKLVNDTIGYNIKSIGKLFSEDDTINLINRAMQAQRAACERNVTNRLSLSLKFNEDEMRVLIAILQVEILSAEVTP